MAKIETAIRDGIARGARRQVRLAIGPLRRELRRLRGVIGQLRRDLAALRQVAARWQRAGEGMSRRPEPSEEEARAARLSPGLVRKLRLRLGLRQSGLARLVGVSAGAVVQWESGRSAPAGQNRRALVGLRKLGRRDVSRLLADLPKPVVGKKAGPAGRRRSRRARPSKRR